MVQRRLNPPRSSVYVEQYEVSSTTNSRQYIVSLKRDGTWACSCEAWKFAKAPKTDCKHIFVARNERETVSVENAVLGLVGSAVNTLRVTEAEIKRERTLELCIRCNTPLSSSERASGVCFRCAVTASNIIRMCNICKRTYEGQAITFIGQTCYDCVIRQKQQRQYREERKSCLNCGVIVSGGRNTCEDVPTCAERVRLLKKLNTQPAQPSPFARPKPRQDDEPAPFSVKRRAISFEEVK